MSILLVGAMMGRAAMLLRGIIIQTGSPTVGTPAIGQVHVLTADGISAAPAVGSPVLAEV
jgi:hypothetical protein